MQIRPIRVIRVPVRQSDIRVFETVGERYLKPFTPSLKPFTEKMQGFGILPVVTLSNLLLLNQRSN